MRYGVHVLIGLIITLVLDIFVIPSGYIQICSGCTTPTCTPPWPLAYLVQGNSAHRSGFPRLATSVTCQGCSMVFTLQEWLWCSRSSDLSQLFFYVLLTVHLDIIFVNNQLDAQFFMYVYFHSLHVSGSQPCAHHQQY